MATRMVQVEPDVKVTDLVGRLSDDSQRLISDEARLAKLEMGESVRMGARGALWLALGFGMGVIALVAVTVLLAIVFGDGIFGRPWPGAMIAGGIDLVAGAVLILVGARMLKETRYTLGESREELRQTAAWISRERAS